MKTKILNQKTELLLGAGLDVLHQESLRMARDCCLLER